MPLCLHKQAVLSSVWSFSSLNSVCSLCGGATSASFLFYSVFGHMNWHEWDTRWINKCYPMSKFFRRISVFWKVDTRSCFFLQKQRVVCPIKHHWGDETYCAKWARWIDHLDLVFFSLKMGRKRKCCRRHYHNKPRHLHRGGPVNDCGVNKDDKKFEFLFHTCEVCWGPNDYSMTYIIYWSAVLLPNNINRHICHCVYTSKQC